MSALASYKELIGYAWATARLGSVVSPAFLCLSIVRRGTTGKTEPKELILGLIMSINLLQQGFLMNDSTVIITNAACAALGVIYISIFLAYNENKVRTVKKNFFLPTAMAGAMIYVRFLPEDEKATFFAKFMTMFLLIVLSSFLLQVGRVVKSKDASGIPLVIVCSKLFMGLTGYLYGLAVNNSTIKNQNMIVSLMTGVLVVLCKLFPGGGKAANSKKEE